MDAAWLLLAGLLSGVMVGLLGVGGGTILVPVLVLLGRSSHVAIGTSSLAMIITTFSGSVQNWQAGQLKLADAAVVGVASVLAAQGGAAAAEALSSETLALAFSVLLLFSLGLILLRERLAERHQVRREGMHLRFLTGLAGGFLAGLFGVGGGVVMVPLLMLLVGDTIHQAARLSLAVIVLTAISAAVAHAWHGNVELYAGLLLGGGGLVGAQIGTRLLPLVSARRLRGLFVFFTLVLVVALVWKVHSGTLI